MFLNAGDVCFRFFECVALEYRFAILAYFLICSAFIINTILHGKFLQNREKAIRKTTPDSFWRYFSSTTVTPLSPSP